MDAAPGREQIVLEGAPHDSVPEPSHAVPEVTTHAFLSDPALLQANKLELVERLADDLAHEIKNPLHSMVINLEVLRRRIARPGGSEPDELMRYTGVLGSELERVNRRVELLLRVLRVDRAGEPTTLHDAVAEILELLEVERDRRGIGIRFEPAPVPVRPTLAPDLARQLVLNLLLTAIDTLTLGDELDVRTEVAEDCIRLRLASPGSTGFPDPADRRVTVARTLAQDLGGRLDLEPHSLLLALPTSAGPRR